MNRMQNPLAARDLVIVSIVWLTSACPASAATLSASSVAELISAIDAANQNAGPDSIALVVGATFTLTDVNNTTRGPTGLPTIADSGKLSILGNGGIIERSAAAGTPAFRLFDVAAGASLALENLTLQGGMVGLALEYRDGGAIYNAGNLALTGVTVQNNIAEGRPGANCVFCGGGSGGPGGWGLGGGIYSVGSLLLENSTLQNNQAQGGIGGRSRGPGGRGGNGEGGGLYAAAGAATLHNSIVTGNVARGGAGGAGYHGYPSGPPGGGFGGGIYIANAQVGLDDFTLAHVTSNTATTSNPNIYGPFEVLPNPLPGDHNGNGTVDAADYVVWRNGLGTNYTQNDYNVWRANFGQIAGSGAGASSNSSIPEPATLVLLMFAAASWCLRRGRSA